MTVCWRFFGWLELDRGLQSIGGNDGSRVVIFQFPQYRCTTDAQQRGCLLACLFVCLFVWWFSSRARRRSEGGTHTQTAPASANSRRSAKTSCSAHRALASAPPGPASRRTALTPQSARAARQRDKPPQGVSEGPALAPPPSPLAPLPRGACRGTRGRAGGGGAEEGCRGPARSGAIRRATRKRV